MPLPWLKNFSSHGTVPLRGPKGGFIQTNPTQGRCRLLLVMKTFAGIHGVTSCPGLATSTSKVQPSAVNM